MEIKCSWEGKYKHEHLKNKKSAIEEEDGSLGPEGKGEKRAREEAKAQLELLVSTLSCRGSTMQPVLSQRAKIE